MLVCLNWLSVCFLGPFFEYLNPFYAYRMFRWCRVRSQGSDSLLTQQEANECSLLGIV